MLGLPTETEEDMKEIADLAEKVASRYYEIPKDQRHGKCQITAVLLLCSKAVHSVPVGYRCIAEEYIARAAHLSTHEFKDNSTGRA